MAEKKAAAGKKTIGVKRWTMYQTSADSAKVKNKECPKCGNSNFMAEHKTRRTCGRCGYTEFKKN